MRNRFLQEIFKKIVLRARFHCGAIMARFALLSRRKLVEKLAALPDFPSSSATPSQYIDLTLTGAERTYSVLSEFIGPSFPEAIDITSIEMDINDFERARELETLFNLYGSDKARTHNYHLLYSKLLHIHLNKPFYLLEIGMGSNNLRIPSNMGVFGSPGASLRAWRDFSPQINVVGGDIDETILFNEERIETHQIDQMDPESWRLFMFKISHRKFDLIIDDGLHSPMANLLTIKNLSGKLADQGVLIVEDVKAASLPIWRILEKLLPLNLHFLIIKTRNAYMVLIKNGDEFAF